MPARFVRFYFYLLPLCFAALLSYNGAAMYYLVPTCVLVLSVPIIVSMWWQRSLPPLGVTGAVVLGYGVWLALSLLWSQSIDTSVLSLSRMLLLPLGYFAVTMLLGSDAKAHPLAAPSAPMWRLMYAFAFIFAILPILDQFVAGNFVRSGGLMYDANLGANIINLINIGLLVLLIIGRLNKWQYLLALAGFFVVFLGFSYGNSRSGSLALLPTFVILAVVGIKQHGLAPALKRAFLPVVLMGLATWLAINPAESLWEKSTGSVDDITQGGTRFFLWQGAWQLFLQHPILGTGAYTYSDLYQTVRIDPSGPGLYAHNDYLQILAETGLIGLGLLLALLALCLYFVYRSLRALWAQQHAGHAVLLALNLWMLAAFVQAGFYFVFYTGAFTLPVGMILALSHHAYLQKPASANQPQWGVLRPFVAVGLLLCCASGYMDDFYMKNQVALRKAGHAEFMHNLELVNVGKAYPKINLAQMYANLAWRKDLSVQQRQLALGYGLDRLCAYLQMMPNRSEGYFILAQLYDYYQHAKWPMQACPLPLPQNKYQALERSIDLAPFTTLEYYPLWHEWLDEESDQNYANAEHERATLKKMTTYVAKVDYQHNQTWAKARQSAEENFAYYTQFKEPPPPAVPAETPNTYRFFQGIFMDLMRTNAEQEQQRAEFNQRISERVPVASQSAP